MTGSPHKGLAHSLQPTSGREIVSLTTLRGLAALCVVLFHMRDHIRTTTLPEQRVVEPFLVSGMMAVPLFFVLSGYVLGLSYLDKLAKPSSGSLARFLAMRLGRVYPVHLAMIVAYAIVFLRHASWPPSFSKASLIANLTLTQAWTRDGALSWNFPAWSISSEWFAYLIFPIAALVLARLSKRGVTVLGACALALSVWVYTFAPLYPYLVHVVPTFIGGVALSVLVPPSSLEGAVYRVVPVALLVITPAWPFFAPNDAVRNAGFIVLFFVFIATLGGTGNRSAPVWTWKPLVFLGDVSYSAYMTHALTYDMIAKFTPVALRDASLGVRCAAVAGMIALVYIVATGMYFVVERPMRDYSRKLLREVPSAGAKKTSSVSS